MRPRPGAVTSGGRRRRGVGVARHGTLVGDDVDDAATGRGAEASLGVKLLPRSAPTTRLPSRHARDRPSGRRRVSVERRAPQDQAGVTCIQHPAWVSVADSDGSGRTGLRPRREATRPRRSEPVSGRRGMMTVVLAAWLRRSPWPWPVAVGGQH